MLPHEPAAKVPPACCRVEVASAVAVVRRPPPVAAPEGGVSSSSPRSLHSCHHGGCSTKSSEEQKKHDNSRFLPPSSLLPLGCLSVPPCLFVRFPPLATPPPTVPAPFPPRSWIALRASRTLREAKRRPHPSPIRFSDTPLPTFCLPSPRPAPILPALLFKRGV